MQSSTPRTKLAALATSAVLLTGGFAALAPTTAHAAKNPTGFAQMGELPTLLPNVAGEITGKVGSGYARPVHLQAKSGSTWKRIASATSNKADGTFVFRKVKLEKSTQVRIDAPAASFIFGTPVAEVKAEAAKKEKAAKKAGQAAKTAKKEWQRLAKKGAPKVKITKARKKFTRLAGARLKAEGAARAAQRVASRTPYVTPWAQTSPETLEVIAQSFSLTMLPGIAQPGTTPTAALDATIANARVYPSQPGRPVTLEVKSGGTWKKVGTEKTDVLGNTVFTVEAGREYRATTIAHAGGSAGTTTAKVAPAFAPEFDDQFDGTALDGTKWSQANRAIGTGLRSCASTDGASSKVGGGVFEMGVSKDPSRSDTCKFTDSKGTHHLPYMRNTQIETAGKYTFKHGIAAARVKVQSAEGMHSSFWSHPTSHLVSNKPELGAEIDVMEYFGDDYHEKGIGAFIHFNKNGETLKDGRVFTRTTGLLSGGNTSMSQQYAVYSVEWTPTEYVFRLDGREFHRTKSNVSQVAQHLNLSMLTSSWELMNLTDFDDTAKVDWVRVWKR